MTVDSRGLCGVALIIDICCFNLVNEKAHHQGKCRGGGLRDIHPKTLTLFSLYGIINLVDQVLFEGSATYIPKEMNACALSGRS